MALSERLELLITANGQAAVREFGKVGDSAEKELSKTQSGLDKTGSTLTSVGTKMIGVGAVLVAGFAATAKASEDANLAHLKLVNTIEKMPKLAGASVSAFEDQASALAQVTKYDDDATKAAQAMLGTFNLTSDEIIKATPLVQDYASKFGVDLVDASKQVGKAFMGQIGALQRNGVTIDKAAYATDHYSAVIDALRQQAGGFAQQEGKTFSGQLEIMKNNLGEVAEGVGVGAVKAFNTLLGPVKSLSQTFMNLDPATQSLVGQIGTFGAVGLIAAGAVSTLVGQAIKMRDNFSAALSGVKSLGTAIRNNLGTTAAVGGVLAVGVLLYQQWAQANQEAAQRSQEFTDTLDKQTGSITDNTKQLQLHKLEQNGATEALAKAGLTLDDYTAAVQDEGGKIKDVASIYSVYSTNHQKAADVLRQAGGARNELLAQLAEEGALTPAVVDSLREESAAYDKNAKALGTRNQVGVATLDQNGKIISSSDQNAQAVADWAEGVDKLNQALKEQQDTERALLDPQFAMIDATQKLTDAQNHYIEVSHYGKIQNAETQAALLDVAKASEDLDFATRNLTNAYQTGAASIDQTRATLAQWVNQGKITQKQADAIAWSLTVTKQKADELTNSTYRVNIDTEEAMKKLQALLTASGQLTQSLEARGIDRTTGGGPTGTRAQGGPVHAGQAYIVGDRRGMDTAEVFTPSVDGYIHPNTNGLGGGNNYTFNFPNYVGSKDDLIAAIREAEGALS